ncbi:MAG TPA: carbohydrate ABC transporter permease [Candidatus Limnocylindrales bacterium]|jgi:raffinose/stachyose/melibiose transport system permease protein
MTTASTTSGVTTASEARRSARRVRVGAFNVASYGILIAVALLILIPIAFAILGGFKSNNQLVGDPGSVIPSPWVVSNYTDVLFGANSGAFWQEVSNSLIVAVIAVAATVVPGALAAFVFARIVFRGREAIYTLFTLGLLFPAAVAILPLYILVRNFGLSGNFLGVALPEAAFGLPLTIIILRPFFRSIPAELEDAARIDGCSTFGFFWRVLLPLARPAIATVSVLAIVSTWNAFILPLILLNGESQWTLPLGVMNFSGTYSADQARILAFTVLAIMPAVIFYAVAERQIVGGLTAGSVKG